MRNRIATPSVGARVKYTGEVPLEHARPGDIGEVVGWPPLRDRFVVAFEEGCEILWPNEFNQVAAEARS